MPTRVIALVVKEFLCLFKDPKSRFVIIGPPIIQVVIFGYAATFDLTHIPFAVYNQSPGLEARELVAGFQGSCNFRQVAAISHDGQIGPLIDDKKALLAVRIGPGRRHRRLRKREDTAVSAADRQIDSLQALGRMEAIGRDIRGLRDRLARAPLWLPGAGLRKQCDRALMLIAAMEERLDRKLVITFIGPCGAGKSTLLNALAGIDDLSAVGRGRPTTRGVVVLSRDRSDAAQLLERLEKEAVTLRSDPAAQSLEHAVLVDTPDTDSTEGRGHVPLVQEIIGLSDVLVCIFDAENPKRRDQVDFLAPHVARFGGESVVVVLNKCDRQEEGELRQAIVPEFRDYIEKAWGRPADSVLCVSARSHLKDPGWSPSALPRHAFDQFDLLLRTVFGGLGAPGRAVDRRIQNAAALRDYLAEEIAGEAGRDRQALAGAAAALERAQAEALGQAVTALKREDDRQAVGLNVLVYQRLAQQWLGPVGWLVALWARVLLFGSGIAALLRFGSPLRQVWGMVSTLRHARDTREAVAESTRDERAADALRAFRSAMARHWPDIAESLVTARFDPSVRREAHLLPDEDRLNRELSGLWAQALSRAVDRASRRLSGPFLQLLFNLPAVAVLAYAGWLTGGNFLAGTYLSADFFLHAFITVGVVLFLSFFLLQACIRLTAGAGRLTARAFREMKAGMEQIRPLEDSPVSEQMRPLLEGFGGIRP